MEVCPKTNNRSTHKKTGNQQVTKWDEVMWIPSLSFYLVCIYIYICVCSHICEDQHFHFFPFLFLWCDNTQRGNHPVWLNYCFYFPFWFLEKLKLVVSFKKKKNMSISILFEKKVRFIHTFSYFFFSSHIIAENNLFGSGEKGNNIFFPLISLQPNTKCRTSCLIKWAWKTQPLRLVFVCW